MKIQWMWLYLSRSGDNGKADGLWATETSARLPFLTIMRRQDFRSVVWLRFCSSGIVEMVGVIYDDLSRKFNKIYNAAVLQGDGNIKRRAVFLDCKYRIREV